MAAPTITSVTVAPSEGAWGDTFTASVDHDGTAPVTLSYQWLWDGQPITGATGSSYTVPGDGEVTTFDPPAPPTGLGAIIL